MGQKLVYVGMGFYACRCKERIQQDSLSRNALGSPTLMAAQIFFCLQMLLSLVIASFDERELDGQYPT